MSKILSYVVCALFCHATITYAHDAHLICKQVRNIFSNADDGSQSVLHSKNIPGRPGKLGRKGDRGDIGHRGPPGVVNYDRIEAAVRANMSSDFDALTAKFNALTKNLARLNEIATKFCDVSYNGKCFYAIVRGTYNVNFNEARDMCQSIGWHLANIYGFSHYTKIEDYLRARIPSATTRIFIWLGMTINTRTKVVSLTSGTNARPTEIKWFPGHPTSEQSRTKMGIKSDNDPNHDSQGIFNYPPSSDQYGALCEK